jgi:ABC-type nickel/cobalt efflux system permease component RcnA
LFKTLTVTAACGLGHVLSSIALGLAGLSIGTSAGKLMGIETFRGNMAAWMLVAFGLVYIIWSLRKQRTGHVHSHAHFHPDGEEHLHEHDHRTEHAHVHGFESPDGKIALWTLFIIFMLGPCEPLIPLIIAGAAKSTATVVLVILVFSIVTLVCMLLMVGIGYYGLRNFAPGLMIRYAHPMAGAALIISGVLALGIG